MNDSHLLENITCRIDKASAHLSHPKEEAKEASPLPKQEFTLPIPSSVVPEGNTEQSMISETASQGEAPRNSDNQSQGIASNSTDSQHGASQNQSRRSRDFEREFNQNGLQYLLQNLDNLREILQIVIMNSELATSLNVDLRNRGLFNLGIAQSLNNTQLSILNSQNQIYDQLRDIRRIIDENSENDSTNSLLNFLNPNNPNLIRNNQNQNPLGILSRILTKIFGVQFSKSYNRFFLFFFVCSIAILMFGLSSLPSSYLGSPAYLIDWIVSQRRSKSVLIGSTLLYVLIILKFNQILYDKYTPDPHREQNFFKDLYVAFAQYTPLYDLTFLLMINPEIVENKLEFFFVFCLLIWYLVMAKVTWLFYQKFNRALVMLNPSQSSELGFIKSIQYIMALYIFLNLLMSYGILWMSWYANDNMFSALLGMTLFTSFEPLKGFVSASISIRNCSIVSNNNTRQLHDPKLQSEIILDALYHVVFLGIICLLGIGYPKYLIGFTVLYCLSGYNALQKLACCYQKYAEWKLIQKRLDEIFPIIEQEKSEDCICSICHEALLIGRKLPCGHIFHLKCFVYWLENKKNCPNCRADLMNLSDIRNHSQQENRFTGWFTRIQELVSNLFN